MTKDQLYLASAVSIALACVSSGEATAKSKKMGKCYGIVKAGENDCSIGTETTCRGSETKDYDPRGWVVLTREDCLSRYNKLKDQRIIDTPFKWEDK